MATTMKEEKMGDQKGPSMGHGPNHACGRPKWKHGNPNNPDNRFTLP
jgi:hypothetical protein